MGMDGMLLSKFGRQGKLDVLKHLFGDLRIRDLTHHVLVPSLKVKL
jgi:patatin-like phospholipase/acyl hydrolase